MDRTALVPGGSGGLGVAVCEALLDRGWRVVVPFVAEAELERLPSHEELVVVEADLTDPAAATRAAGAVERTGAPLKALVHLVGGFAAGQPVATTPVEQFEAQHRLNVRTAYTAAQAAWPLLEASGGGAIVLVGTKATQAPFAGAAGYVTAKAAVQSLAQVLAVEGRPKGIRANAVLPSVIDTEQNRRAMPSADPAKWVTPAALARVIAFLASDESAPTSGALVPAFGAS